MTDRGSLEIIAQEAARRIAPLIGGRGYLVLVFDVWGMETFREEEDPA